PTRGLDYGAKARLVTLLRALAAEGHAIVMATHDVELAAGLAHRVVLLAEGEVIADGPAAEVVVAFPSFAPQVAKIPAPQHRRTGGGRGPPGGAARRARVHRRRARRGGRRLVPVLRPAGRQVPRPAALAHGAPGPRGAVMTPQEPRRAPRPERGPERKPGAVDRQARAIRLGPRSLAALALVSAVGVAGFGWPFLAPPASTLNAHAQDAPWLFAGLLVLLVAVVAATISESGLGPKAVAMLGVLAAT